MPRYLTKSRFKLAVECPTKLFYSDKEKLYRNIKNEDSFLQALADGGFQVGKLAQLLWPSGYEITSKNHEEAEQETQKRLSLPGEVVLFEPAIRYNNLFIRIDVLIKRESSMELIEVKAKSYDSSDPQIVGARGGILAGMLPYLQDVAFQKYVLSKAHPDKTITSYLLMPDKAVNTTIDGLNQLFKVKREGRSTDVVINPRAYEVASEAGALLAKVNVDEFVDFILAKPIVFPGGSGLLPAISEYWAHEYENDERISPVLSSACKSCEFRAFDGDGFKSGFHECLREVTKLTDSQINEGTIFDVTGLRKKDEYLAQGLYTPRHLQHHINVKNDKDGLSLSQRQFLQCAGIAPEDDKGSFYLDADLIKNQMRGWVYPLHMIDFETSTIALPLFKGMRPYETIAFQFSHHVMYEDGSVEHVGEFIQATPGRFPNFEFVRALKKELENDKGTIFRWATHENTVLNAISIQMDKDGVELADKAELQAFIRSITKGGKREMVDLNVLATRAYYHPMTFGRTSIKKVLPAVLSTSPYLKKKYSKGIYGATLQKEGLIPSLNFKDHTWWREQDGNVIDPYDSLKNLAVEMLGEEGADALVAEDMEIAEGGAAATAYARLQFEDLSEADRVRIESALLRYCELDTLAMVMIVEAWREWSLL
jgi:hypothetical protein